MTNFPTRQHWFDFIWPEGPSKPNEKILVPVQRHTDFEELAESISSNPKCIFMLAVEDFDHFSSAMPALWLRMPPDGGIPPNVWVGAAVGTQKSADERMKRLVRIRARKLFVMLKREHTQSIDLKAGLVSWRCPNCGRKDGYGRILRPKKCPSGSICQGVDLGPQIHWVVSMDMHRNTKLSALCAQHGVAFWDNQSLQVPE